MDSDPPEPKGALRTRFEISGESDGSLAGCSFAVKDAFALVGHANAFGNPDWLSSHAPATSTAPSVQALLDAGARLIGVTHMDELAYSLSGDNTHYGAPQNPAAKARTAGGSSSGSAALVAAAQVDFALGTDTAGSVRVPASYCGIFGFRPSHAAISTEGVIPLAPSFDTVGWFARDPQVLRDVGHVLLPPPNGNLGTPARAVLAEDLLALVPEPIATGIESEAEAIAQRFGLDLERVELSSLGAGTPDEWMRAFIALQAGEVWAAHGDWLKRVRPRLGPGVAERVAALPGLADDVEAVTAGTATRERLRAAIASVLGPGCLLVLPSAAGVAPRLEDPDAQSQAFRERTLQLTALASLAGLPQVSLPALELEGLPVGLSLAALPGADALLLQTALRWSCP